MSDTESRKSMDDVLASIRRIVRSEKEPAEADVASEVADLATDAAAETMDAADAPLELTPDMRLDDAPETSTPDHMSVPPAINPAMDPPPSSETQMESSTVPGGTAVATSDDEIREIVRAVLLEELKGDAFADIVRSILRDELYTGETGSNISQNVMTLIETEIAKASR